MDNPNEQRAIYTIAAEIRKSWKNVNYAAEPYLKAMFTLIDKDSNYIADSATDIVLRFLCNANGWRGEDARRIKKELKSIVGLK